MGSATKHRRKFLAEHPTCVFCGGVSESSTIEHCPPRAMFQHRQWPEGFEFPSCINCNHGSSDADILVSMVARMDPIQEKGDLDGRMVGIMMAANRQHPGLFQRMLPTASEARRRNREMGLSPKPGFTHQETGAVKVPDEINAAVGILATKLAKGIYYRETNNIFPNDGCLLLNWFSNADLIRTGRYPMLDLLQELHGTAPRLERSGNYLNDQFEYKLSISPTHGFFILQTRFGNAFGFVLFGSAESGPLEKIIERLRSETNREGPFAVLQSASLK